MSRKPSADAHQKVLKAALELIADRGVEGTSMDAIAERSGVSKATIYNHWANKEALLIEVMLFVNGLDRIPPDPDTGDPCRDIAIVLGCPHDSRCAAGDYSDPAGPLSGGFWSERNKHGDTAAIGIIGLGAKLFPQEALLKACLDPEAERHKCDAGERPDSSFL